ncbi:MAG: hypothetical protein JO323_17650 [Acidobacteriia bacterium]|nr:hypothetical protein [Terriglobia bacterium]
MRLTVVPLPVWLALRVLPVSAHSAPRIVAVGGEAAINNVHRTASTVIAQAKAAGGVTAGINWSSGTSSSSSPTAISVITATVCSPR